MNNICTYNELLVKDTKSVAINFKGNNVSGDLIFIQINNNLSLSCCFKLIDIVVDDNLKLKNHLSSISNKTKKKGE